MPGRKSKRSAKDDFRDNLQSIKKRRTEDEERSSPSSLEVTESKPVDAGSSSFESLLRNYLVKDLTVLEKKIKLKHDKIRHLEDELIVKNNQIIDYRNEVLNTKEELSKKISNLLEENCNLKNKLDNLEKKSVESFGDVIKELKRKLEVEENQNHSSESRIMDLEDKNRMLQKKLNDQERIRSMESISDREKYKSRISDLTEENEELNNLLAEKEIQFGTLREQVDKMTSEVKIKDSSINLLKETLTDLQTKLETSKTDTENLKTVNNKISEEISDLKQQHSRDMNSLQNQFSQERVRILSQGKDEVEKLTESVGKVNKENNKLTEDLKSLSTYLKEQEAAREKDLLNSRNYLEKLTKQKHEFEARLKKCQDQSLKERKALITQQNIAVNNRSTELENKHKKELTKLQEIQTSLQAKNKSLEEKQAELQRKVASLERVKTNEARLYEKMKSLETDLKESLTEYKTLSQTSREKEKELETMKNLVKEMQTKLSDEKSNAEKNLQDFKAKCQVQVTNQIKNYDSLMKHLKQVRVEKESLETKLTNEKALTEKNSKALKASEAKVIHHSNNCEALRNTLLKEKEALSKLSTLHKKKIDQLEKSLQDKSKKIDDLKATFKEKEETLSKDLEQIEKDKTEEIECLKTKLVKYEFECEITESNKSSVITETKKEGEESPEKDADEEQLVQNYLLDNDDDSETEEDDDDTEEEEEEQDKLLAEPSVSVATSYSSTSAAEPTIKDEPATKNSLSSIIDDFTMNFLKPKLSLGTIQEEIRSYRFKEGWKKIDDEFWSIIVTQTSEFFFNKYYTKESILTKEIQSDIEKNMKKFLKVGNVKSLKQ